MNQQKMGKARGQPAELEVRDPDGNLKTISTENKLQTKEQTSHET